MQWRWFPLRAVSDSRSEWHVFAVVAGVAAACYVGAAAVVAAGGVVADVAVDGVAVFAYC